MTFLSTIRVSSLTIQTLLLFFFAKFIYFHNLPVVQRVEFLQCSFSYIFTTDVKCLTYLWKAKGNPRLNTYNYKVTIGIFIFHTQRNLGNPYYRGCANHRRKAGSKNRAERSLNPHLREQCTNRAELSYLPRNNCQLNNVQKAGSKNRAELSYLPSE
jgi:hypothetical protein